MENAMSAELQTKVPTVLEDPGSQSVAKVYAVALYVAGLALVTIVAIVAAVETSHSTVD